MASKTTYPGWGYMLANGATTAREGWTGQSHIHDTLISIGAWFIEGIGGIRPDERAPGFRHFFVKPAVVGDLSFAKARYRSIRGEIVSEWHIDKGNLTLTVTVPPGATATVVVPGEGLVRTKAKVSASPAARGRSFDVGPGGHVFEAAIGR
jgi:alpha-L-rhamnosidase